MGSHTHTHSWRGWGAHQVHHVEVVVRVDIVSVVSAAMLALATARHTHGLLTIAC